MEFYNFSNKQCCQTCSGKRVRQRQEMAIFGEPIDYHQYGIDPDRPMVAPPQSPSTNLPILGWKLAGAKPAGLREVFFLCLTHLT